MISPSFMTNAQAFVMDNNYQKGSFGKDISIKYVKCNNINANVNGFELSLNSIPEVLGGEVAAEESDTGASSFGSNGGSNNGPSGFDNKGFVFVCINNNNNVGQGGGGTGENEDECAEKLETCFRGILGEEFNTFQTELSAGVELVIGGNEVTVSSFADLCEELVGIENSRTLSRIILTLETETGVDLSTTQQILLIGCIAGAIGLDLELTSATE